MKKYQSYKPSGVEWIGDIPENWLFLPLKYFYNYTKGKNGQLLTSTYIDENKGVYPVHSGMTNNDGVLGYWNEYEFDYKTNVIFTTTVGVKFMTTKLLKGKFSLSQNCLIMYPKNNLSKPDFIHYYLEYDFLYQKELIPTIIQPSLRMEDLDKYFICLPTIQEQEQIVKYLDEKTTIIDKLISTKQRKVELLKEQRTTLINQVVTKGLNPNVKMKDSSVEWIGEIPEGWKVGRLGYFSNVYRGSGYQYLNQVDEDFVGRKERVVRISDISEFNPIWFEYLEQFENYRIKKDEILMGGTGHYFGKSIYVTDEMEGLIHSYNIIRIVVKNLITKFIQYYISSQMIREQMDMSVLGSGQPFIDLQGLKDLIILIPEINEQHQIVEHLDSKTKEIDDLVHLEKKKIDLLKEYRQSLISEVVTGKIKVTTDE